MKDNQNTELSFEQRLALIEKKIDRLGQGDLPLATAFSEYEEGILLLRQAQDMLNMVEKQVLYLQEGKTHEF